MSTVKVLSPETEKPIDSLKTPSIKSNPRSKLRLKVQPFIKQHDSDSIETNHSQINDNSQERRSNVSREDQPINEYLQKENIGQTQTQFPTSKFKTEKCKNFELFGDCKFGSNCFFAHGKNELRSKVSFSNFYKTKLCRNYFKNGFCQYASRCQYFHLKSSEMHTELFDSYVNKIYAKIISNEKNVFVPQLDHLNDGFKTRLPLFIKLLGEDKISIFDSEGSNETQDQSK